VAILIHGGKLVDPVRNRVEEQDLLIEGERVVRILPTGVLSDAGPLLRKIDARNRLVVPGLVDMHVHLREPGYEHKETIATGSLSGVAEGLRRCLYAEYQAGQRSGTVTEIPSPCQEANVCRVYPIAAITLGQQGKHSPISLNCKPERSVSDDGQPVKSASSCEGHGLENPFVLRDLTVRT
jgi:dihydroorotase